MRSRPSLHQCPLSSEKQTLFCPRDAVAPPLYRELEQLAWNCF
jgi:hypothetical protein